MNQPWELLMLNKDGNNTVTQLIHLIPSPTKKESVKKTTVKKKRGKKKQHQRIPKLKYPTCDLENSE